MSFTTPATLAIARNILRSESCESLRSLLDLGEKAESRVLIFDAEYKPLSEIDKGVLDDIVERTAEIYIARRLASSPPNLGFAEKVKTMSADLAEALATHITTDESHISAELQLGKLEDHLPVAQKLVEHILSEIDRRLAQERHGQAGDGRNGKNGPPDRTR